MARLAGFLRIILFVAIFLVNGLALVGVLALILALISRINDGRLVTSWWQMPAVAACAGVLAFLVARRQCTAIRRFAIKG